MARNTNSSFNLTLGCLFNVDYNKGLAIWILHVSQMLTHLYQMYFPILIISNFRVVGGIFHFFQILKDTSVSKQWRT